MVSHTYKYTYKHAHTTCVSRDLFPYIMKGYFLVRFLAMAFIESLFGLGVDAKYL